MNDDLNGLDLDGNKEGLEMSSDLGTDDETDLENLDYSAGHAAG
ncbi:hypothetical protein [Deinococcus altitudinis]